MSAPQLWSHTYPFSGRRYRLDPRSAERSWADDNAGSGVELSRPEEFGLVRPLSPSMTVPTMNSRTKTSGSPRAMAAPSVGRKGLADDREAWNRRVSWPETF
jgi:hypothetical protein